MLVRLARGGFESGRNLGFDMNRRAGGKRQRVPPAATLHHLRASGADRPAFGAGLDGSCEGRRAVLLVFHLARSGSGSLHRSEGSSQKKQSQQTGARPPVAGGGAFEGGAFSGGCLQSYGRRPTGKARPGRKVSVSAHHPPGPPAPTADSSNPTRARPSLTVARVRLPVVLLHVHEPAEVPANVPLVERVEAGLGLGLGLWPARGRRRQPGRGHRD